MSTSNHAIHRVHEYESRSDSTPTTTELTLQARVGLAFGILGAIMLTIILTSLIVLRIQRGPSITLWTLFSRKPLPKRRTRQDESAAAAAAGLSDEERGTSPPPAYTHPLSEETPKADTVIQPQQAHITPSLRKELNLHIDTTHPPPSRISTTTTATTTKQKPTPLRTMSDTEILRSSTSPEKEREAHSTLKVQIHHDHHNNPYYNRLRTGSPRSPASTGNGSSGTRSDRLHPPEEYAVPPDSPDVIVLPSPRELQKFRINVYR
ncbi:hypothetical protein ASPBRDRAFT_64416 [Aspergillus brasiliensis CBS 101740]|uniref:Uncharacterized protein n=1 Tax=Aspergillus brasiliensis (strain CBS 101740 / IMI 381727 / IBT 21946) TaxID=767769 RepID=A0A1L9UPW4_ASPBC|nr:hypothetical protein ASPBRDRAFT_64416 [Aspergillus brasiliensis CBS 101740]